MLKGGKDDVYVPIILSVGHLLGLTIEAYRVFLRTFAFEMNFSILMAQVYLMWLTFVSRIGQDSDAKVGRIA